MMREAELAGMNSGLDTIVSSLAVLSVAVSFFSHSFFGWRGSLMNTPIIYAFLATKTAWLQFHMHTESVRRGLHTQSIRGCGKGNRTRRTS
jgi:hypothetical protein